MKDDTNNAVITRIETYPENAQQRLLALRELIFSVAEGEGINDLTETLKWGEPSYTCKSGSTLRMDWKAKNPHTVYLFFHCQTKLVDTFRELFSDVLDLEGNRAIVLPLSVDLPKDVLSYCIAMALRYHQVKQLPLLGFVSLPQSE